MGTRSSASGWAKSVFYLFITFFIDFRETGRKGEKKETDKERGGGEKNGESEFPPIRTPAGYQTQYPGMSPDRSRTHDLPVHWTTLQ